MNMICFNVLCFLVEFIKLFLVVTIFFQIKQHKSIYASFLLSLFLIIFLSVFIDLSNFGIEGIVAVLLLILNAYEKKKAGMIILSFLGISIVDMIFASVCIVVFHLDAVQLERNAPLNISLNLFSLFCILVISAVLYQKQEKYQQIQIRKYIAIYCIGGFALSCYLTSLQFLGMGEKWSVYGTPLIISMSLGSLVLVVLCALLVINSNQNEYLKKEAKINADLLEAQKEYYTLLLEKEKETKAFRHDIRQHLYCIQNLYRHKKYEELEISALDLCTIFYNLLSNAFEAAGGTQGCEVTVTVSFMEAAMMLCIRNPVTQEPRLVNGEFLTTKSEEGHGYGIGNVKKCVDKNGGSYAASYENGCFVTEIIIPKAL